MFSSQEDVDVEVDMGGDVFNQYLSGEKKFRVCIFNERNEIILPTIETSIDDVQENIRNQLECGKSLNNSFGFVVPQDEMYVDFKDESGKTKLHLAVLENNAKLVKVMLPYHMSNLHKEDNSGKTPIHYAFHNREIMEILLTCDNCPADIFLQVDSNGKNVLHHYCSSPVDYCKKAVVENIIRKAAERTNTCIISSRDNFGNTPFYYARRQGDYSILEILSKCCLFVVTTIHHTKVDPA